MSIGSDHTSACDLSINRQTLPIMDQKEKSTPVDVNLESTLTETSRAEGQVFERIELKQDRFSTLSVIGIQFSITAAPIAILLFSGLVTGVGGTSYFFWCFLISMFGQISVAASLAEIAAFLPHASGMVLSLPIPYP